MPDKSNIEEFKKKMQGKEFLSGQELSSINKEDRTVDCIFFTGIDVPRTDWWTGEKYVLRFDPKGADFSLLNNGAPIFDNHSSWGGTISQKGRVEKAWQEGKLSKASLRFSKRKSVDEIWQDVEDKIITKFSMGVSILAEEKFQENNMEIRLAKKWQPFEISMAPIPADFGTTTLSADQENINNTQLGTQRPEENKMPDQVPGTGAQTQSITVDATAAAQQILSDHAKAEANSLVLAETARIISIRKITKQLGLSDEFGDKHIEALTPLDKFRAMALDKQAEEAINFAGTRTHTIRRGIDEADKRREAMSGALARIVNPKDVKDDGQNPFMGLSMRDIATESVRLAHGMTRMPAKDKVAELAMQTTSDFAYVLENVARKQLLNRYEAIAPTYRVWCKASTSPDFKTMSRVRLSETPSFIKVPEGAQITIGMMSDTREQYTLATYGRGVSFTRQMLINDDLGAFNDLIGAFGVQAARLENKTVYAILTANANMADSNPLFDDTTHHNTGAGVLGNTAYDDMFGKMGAQLGLDGETVLNLVPRYVIVPKAKESTARASLLATGANLAASSQNWFTGRLEVVADGELDTNGSGTTKWYAAADPNLFPGIEYCHLEGAEGPQFVRKDNESGILGIQFYAYVDFAAKAVDWRSLYYSTGS